MIASEIHEHMADYAAILSDVVELLQTPRSRMSLAQRQELTALLNAITDVSTMMLYHFNCQHASPEMIMEIRDKVAQLAPRARPGQVRGIESRIRV